MGFFKEANTGISRMLTEMTPATRRSALIKACRDAAVHWTAFDPRARRLMERMAAEGTLHPSEIDYLRDLRGQAEERCAELAEAGLTNDAMTQAQATLRIVNAFLICHQDDSVEAALSAAYELAHITESEMNIRRLEQSLRSAVSEQAVGSNPEAPNESLFGEGFWGAETSDKPVES